MSKRGKNDMTMGRSGYHQNEYPEGISRVLEDLEDVFNLTERPLYNHARAGHIIGINYSHGVWHFSVKPGLEGPVSDKPREYLLPSGKLRGVYPQLISGEVSCQLYVGSIIMTRKKNLVELYGVLSGANCRPLVDYNTQEGE